ANQTLYAVPALNHGTHGRLRLEPTKNGQAKFVRLADDYVWKRHIEELRQKYAWQGSNLRPPVPETGALSTELQAREANFLTGLSKSQNVANSQRVAIRIQEQTTTER